MHLSPGATLQNGKYKLTSILGHGGFGITYLAVQKGLDRKVAVKEFFMKDFCSRHTVTSHVSIVSEGAREQVERFRQKFLKEARTIAALDDPHIIRIYDVFEENGTAYYVMEYIEGGSLKDLIAQRGNLSETEAMNYAVQLADALNYLHSHHILHLDLKPANVLLKRSHTAVLIDFGVSKRYDAEGGQTSSTPTGLSKGYAPLEQYKTGGLQHFQPCTDLYSLGAILYTLLTGQIPPEASDVNNDGLPPLPPEVSARTAQTIEKAMSPRAKDRPQTASEFLAMLNETEERKRVESNGEIQEETKIGVSHEKAKLPNASGKRKRLAGIIGTTVLLIASAGYMLTLQKSPDSKGTAKFGELFYLFEGDSGKIGAVWPQSTDKVTVIPPRYDAIGNTWGFMNEGRISVRIGDKWGFLDWEGKEITPVKYDDVSQFQDSVAEVRLNSLYGAVNAQGREVIPVSYDYFGDLQEELRNISVNGKRGFIDKEGHIVITPKYDHAWDFQEGMAAVRQGERWGFINKEGKEVIPIQYENYPGNFSEGLAAVKSNGKYGYIDKTGKTVLPFIYEDAQAFHRGIAAVKLQWGWELISREGTELTPAKYEDLRCTDTYVIGKLNGKWALLDREGKQRTVARYDDIFNEVQGLIEVKSNDRYGIIDTLGTEILAPQYDYVRVISNDTILFRCNNNKEYGLASHQGKELLSKRYEWLECHNESGIILFGQDGKYGAINQNGKEILPCQYDRIKYANGLFYARKDNEHYYIDRKGKVHMTRHEKAYTSSGYG